MLSDAIYIFYWWVMFFLIGVTFLPLSYLFFKKFTGAGYGLSKIIGSLTITYTVFVGSLLKIFPFNETSVKIIFVILASFNIFLLLTHKKTMTKAVKEALPFIIVEEILFTLGFAFWSFVRANNPDIRGLEKFMDFGFINSALKSSYLPPVDMWFAGKSINYYWFGHLWSAVMTRLSQIPSYITYNLIIATIAGLVLTSVFAIVSSLIKSINLNKRRAFAAGIISAFVLTFAGNFHTPYYTFKDGLDNYWYPDATRFIGYNPDTNDKTIHEFPLYSFVVSDLHAHLLNLPFVILFIALLFSYLQSKSNKKLSQIKLLSLGFLFAVFFMTNTWDVGNYLVLTGVLFTIFAIKKKGVTWSAVYSLILKLIIILLSAAIFAIPFILHFDSIAKGVAPVNTRSPLWQITILWGLPFILFVSFGLFYTFNKKRFKTSDYFVSALILSSLVLIVLPEIIYVKDIYIASHHRANTMFKLTYQAFVMSYLTSGFVFVRIINSVKIFSQKALIFILSVAIFSALLMYPYFAIKTYYNNLKSYKSLSGRQWIKDFYPDIYTSIVWLEKNTFDQPTILEASGDSYTDYNIISSYTGLPTVSGWFVHEWLWRGEPSFPQKRSTDVQDIYTSQSLQLTESLLEKYSVNYVIVSEMERKKYPKIFEGKFEELGKRVFSSGSVTIYKIY